MTVPRRRRESGMSIPLLEGKTESRLPGPPEAHRREDSKDDPQNNVGVVPRNGPVADESEGDGRKKHGERGQEMWLHGLSSLWRRAAPSGPGIPPSFPVTAYPARSGLHHTRIPSSLVGRASWGICLYRV